MSPVACKICGGSEASHKNTKHVFTTLPGDLRPPPEPKEKPQGAAGSVPKKPAECEHSASYARLIRVLIDKGVLDVDDVMQIVGLGPTQPPGVTQ